MPTARERMLELSPLASGVSAREHFLAITQGTGDITVYEQTTVFLMPDLEVTLEEELSTQLEEELVVEIEKELIVEVC